MVLYGANQRLRVYTGQFVKFFPPFHGPKIVVGRGHVSLDSWVLDVSWILNSIINYFGTLRNCTTNIQNYSV
jgi:hypothetical protein